MVLKEITVSKKNPYYQEICGIMKASFPDTELLPMWMLRLMAQRKYAEFIGLLDGDALCGILFTAENEKYVFVLYLAVSEKIRSKGYGSQLLDFVKEKANGREIILHAEYPDETKDNATQRSRRMDFYAKNGIVNTGYWFGEGAEKYIVLSTDGRDADMKSYKDLLRYLSFGLYAPEIKRINA